MGLRWTPHWLLKAKGREVCVRCGFGPHKMGVTTLRDRPCPGLRPLRAAAAVALRKRGFVEALSAAPELWREQVHRDLCRN